MFLFHLASRSQAILSVDQLPDSRRAILLALKRQGPSTIAQLAYQLQLTGEAVRQQLLQLQREGWIESRVARTIHLPIAPVPRESRMS